MKALDFSCYAVSSYVACGNAGRMRRIAAAYRRAGRDTHAVLQG